MAVVSTMSTSENLGLLSGHPYAGLLPLAIAEGPLVTITVVVLVAGSQLWFWSALAIVVIGDPNGAGAAGCSQWLPARWIRTPSVR